MERPGHAGLDGLPGVEEVPLAQDSRDPLLVRGKLHHHRQRRDLGPVLLEPGNRVADRFQFGDDRAEVLGQLPHLLLGPPGGRRVEDRQDLLGNALSRGRVRRVGGPARLPHRLRGEIAGVRGLAVEPLFQLLDLGR